MAETVAELEARLLALRAVRDSGMQSVRHGDTSTMARPMSEILKAIKALEDEIRALSGAVSTRRVRYAWQSNKGL